MAIQAVIDKIKKGSWYRQGGTITPFFVLDPYLCMYEEVGHDNIFVVQKGEWNMGYFEKEEEKKATEANLNNYIKDPEFLKKRIKAWRESVKKQQDKLKELCDVELEDPKVKQLLKEYFKLVVDTWQMAMIIETTDPWGDYFVQKHASNYDLSEDEASILVNPTDLTFLQQETIDRQEIAESDNLSKIKQHNEKYYWYLTSWQKAVMTGEEHFETIIKKDIKNIDALKEEVKKILDHQEMIKKKKKEIIEKHNIDEKTQLVFQFFSEIADWRDVRKKEAVCKINYELQGLMEKLAEYNDLSIELANHIIIGELESFKLTDEYKQELITRTKGYYLMYYNEDDERDWLYGEDAETVFNALEDKIISDTDKVEGKPAFKGVVKGKVKVIDNIKDFDKMEEGDILMSIATRPELMPVMKKAGAIVTDEGGITSHAAIVSRELKTPCIVGTQTATRIFKDGDLVEVDADNGIVRKLK